MKRDIIISLMVHIVILGAAAFPLSISGTREVPEAIVVQLADMPYSPIQEMTPNQPPAIPPAMEEAEPEIPISDPTTAPEAEIPEPEPVPDEPEPEPEPEEPTDPPENRIIDAPEGEQDQSGSDETEVDVDVAGTPFGKGVKVDNASFNYPYWFTLALNKLKQNFRNPLNVQGRIVAAVKFTVIQSGKVIEIEIVESSGYPVFDNAAKAAVERSDPFPPLPREFPDEIISINVPFVNN